MELIYGVDFQNEENNGLFDETKANMKMVKF